nr:hypothetical protein [Tanacetum cinerariifolium]
MQFLKELRDNTFSVSDHEDANEHIEKVLEIVDLFHVPNITQDQIMLQLFHMSLIGATSRWLRNKPSGSIKTWEDLKIKFLIKYCPPTQTAKEIEEINNFQQEPDETLYQSSSSEIHQRNNANPSYQERRQSMEESLSKFMSESVKRHEENSNLIKEIRASTGAAIRNQGASIKTLEIRIGQMSKDRTVKHPKGIAENVLVGIVVENMDGYRDQDMEDVIFEEPFCKASCVAARRSDRIITIHNDLSIWRIHAHDTAYLADRLDLAGKEIDEVGEVLIIWNPMCVL